MTAAKLIIDKKREGRALGSAEIRDFVNGFTAGEIPDCQMSALAMAICCRGMTVRETADLTDVMMRSGASIDWKGVVDWPVADKHSTGGVGDKLSFVIQPLAAACGLAVPSLVGRGLGLTGGTADKLESIPGYKVSLSIDELRRVVAETGLAMATQTAEIAPADRKLYALRDVTGTVASIPLITASILSKKLAEGAETIVFDVKCGRGAFMKDQAEAHALAESLVSGVRAAGRRAAALVTDMDAPLGFAVGNACEVEEALAMLSPGAESGPLAGIVGLSVEFAALMVSLARGVPLDDARAECRARLGDGSALAKFREMVAAQGGDLDAFARLVARPKVKYRIQSMRSGYVESIDAERVARVALSLGAGRWQPGDRIDHLAGVRLAVGRGDKVSIGSPLATLENSSDPDALERAAAELQKAFTVSPTPPEAKPLVLERIG